jgi:prophage regulatory protein
MRREKRMTNSKPKIFLRKPEVRKRTGLSDTTIWRQEKIGKFPARIHITEYIVGWDEDEIVAYQQALLDSRDIPTKKGEIKMAITTNMFEKPNKTHLNTEDLALIKAAMAEDMPFGQIFTCAIDKGGEHLECEVDYDSGFCPEGYDYENGKAEDWVRISVLHPRYLLFMASILVQMDNGLLNFDEELEADIFQCPKMISEKRIMFLSDVLLPAIKLRVAAGKNPPPFPHGSMNKPSYIGEI